MRYSNQKRPVRLTSSKLKSLIRQTIRESKYDDPSYQSRVSGHMSSEITDDDLRFGIAAIYTSDARSGMVVVQDCLEQLTGLSIDEIHSELLDAFISAGMRLK